MATNKWTYKSTNRNTKIIIQQELISSLIQLAKKGATLARISFNECEGNNVLRAQCIDALLGFRF